MRIIFTVILILIFSSSFAQTTNKGEPLSWNLDNNKHVQTSIQLSALDIKLIKEEDQKNDAIQGKPWRYGIQRQVDYGLTKGGVWTELDNGDRIWRIAFHSPEAINLSFNFDKFYLPNGASLYLYSDDRSDLLGAYTSQANNEHNMLGTWLVKGDKVWLEYFEPKEANNKGELHVSSLVHGYRLGKEFQKNYNLNTKGLNDSGDCNHDVDCPIGQDFEDHKDILKKSVAFLSMGNGFICSGALVNNTAEDKTPYFLTANHCYFDNNDNPSNPALYSMRFNWISPNPVCGATTNSTNSPDNFTMNGATLRARNEGSDYMLVEINNPIPEDWELTYAGWDRSDSNPSYEVGIHHPSGDIMKIARDDSGATKANAGGTQVWLIGGGSQGTGDGWEIGVTEGGSSGSPLFNQNGHIIGELFAGQAACNGTIDNNEFDVYGRFAVAWDQGASSSERLRDWLDPLNLGPLTLDSFIAEEKLALDGSLNSSSVTIDCDNFSATPSIVLRNEGLNTLTSATIDWFVDNQSQTQFQWTGSLESGESESIQLPSVTVNVGNHILRANINSLNEATDQNSIDNESNINFNIADGLRTNIVKLTLTTDNFPNQTSWQFKDENNNVIASGGPYDSSQQATTIEETFIVQSQMCYTFEINDSLGNGICCNSGNGSFSLKLDNDDVIYESNGTFEFKDVTKIKVDDLNFQPENIVLYPNPSTDGVYNIIGFVSGLEYEVFNQLGQKVYNGQLQTNELNISHLTGNLYFIRITSQISGEEVIKPVFLAK